MTRFTLSFAALALVACSSDATSSGPAGDGGGGGGAEPTSLPCDVAPIVEAHCTICHGEPLRSGAPQALLSLEQWRADAPTLPGTSNGALSVIRMGDTNQPMPPSGAITAEEQAVIADWVNAGMPGGECTAATTPDPALDAQPTCTSMETWPAPSHFAPGHQADEMFPGMPCIGCHTNPSAFGQNEGGPNFDLGGTVYLTAHEPDNCFGVDGATFSDVIVHIEDANGSTWDLPVDATGNFFLAFSGLVPPYSAKVINDVGIRAMSYKPMSGDCNSCHTAEGSNGGDPAAPTAPGRILAP